MKKFRKVLFGFVGAVSLGVMSSAALADYPNKPIQLVVPYGAGGDSDLTMRVWADAIEKVLDNPVAVINRAGGSGVVGTTYGANAKSDGYTLTNTGTGNIQVATNFSDTPYDFDSFTHIMSLVTYPMGLVVSSDSPYETFEDFVEAAKEKPVTIGSYGAAAGATILSDIIAKQMGYQPRYVHGDTTADSIASVLGGHIDAAVSFPPAFDSHVEAGKMRILAIAERMPHHPDDVPLFSDFGIEGDFGVWGGISAPSGVPQEVVDTLIQATEQVMEDPKVIEAYENIGAIVDFQHGDEWVADIRTTYDLMNEIAQEGKDN